MGQSRPLSKGDQCPSVPIIFGTAYMRARTMSNNNQILHDDQTRCEGTFYSVDHES